MGEDRFASETRSRFHVYDGDGKRVEESVSVSVSKIYWYAPSGQVLDETDGTGSISNSAFNEYVFFGGQRAARRDSSNDVYYYFADHLGTSRTIAEIPSGQSTATLCYDADFYSFGGERTPIVNFCSQNYKFTSKERDTESGLDNFGARFNSSIAGRFMSPDPLGGHREDPQSLNRYAYARDNPLKLTDPTGLDVYLQCTPTTDADGNQVATSTCQQQIVGYDKNGNAQTAWVQGLTDEKGNFTPTLIGNDANGNLVDKTTGTGTYTASVNGSGVQFSNDSGRTFSTGVVVNGTPWTSFQDAGWANGASLSKFYFAFKNSKLEANQTAAGSFIFSGTQAQAADALLSAGFTARSGVKAAQPPLQFEQTAPE